MRKFIVVASLLLASGGAQAGQSRGLTLASGAVPTEQIQSQLSTPSARGTIPVKADMKIAPGKTVIGSDPKRPPSCAPHDHSREDDRLDRKPARHPETAEHKARRIAARYGVYW